jgi:Pentapeptide repeats (8 copies)
MANAQQVALLKKSAGDWNKRRDKDPKVIPDFSGAELRGTDLHGAILGGANLRWTFLIGANLLGANLDGTRLAGAMVGYTIFGDVDLGVAKELGTVHHTAPSTIGVDTILKSGGKIPDEFLIRGCGVDPLIQKMLVGDGQAKTDAFYAWISRRHNPVQRCFISYATEDKAFVDRLQKALTSVARTIGTPRNMGGGVKNSTGRSIWKSRSATVCCWSAAKPP